jgi:uncharacterized protein (TIGR02172 family)
MLSSLGTLLLFISIIPILLLGAVDYQMDRSSTLTLSERKKSMLIDLSQPIAYGRTAEIYAWHPGQILKLFYNWFGLENIEHEARVSRAIHASGLPTPAVGEIIRVNERFGLEYERLYGESLFKIIQRKPWKFHYARRWAELQAAVHATTIQTVLPSQKQILERNIKRAGALPTYLRSKVLTALEAMPDGEQLCHGDFWPGNILMTEKGEIIIDWIHASRGNPLADLARTTNLILGYTRTSQIRRPFLSYSSSKTSSIKNSLLQILCRIFYPVFLNYYFELCPGNRDEYQRWLPIVAAARLSDNIPELEKMLVAQVERNY